MQRILLSLVLLFSLQYHSLSNDGPLDNLQHILGNLWEVDVYGDELIAACGDNGIIMLSRDAGKTWVQPYTRTDIPLYDIICPDASTIIAAGQKGIILQSYDKGKNWKSDTVGTEQENFLSLAIEGDTILAVTNIGTMYRSLDRGISWTSVFTLPTALSKVFSLSQGQWLIGDRRGGIWYSDNNGMTWNQSQGDTIYNCAECRVKAFTRLDNNTVLALANSTLFRSTDNGKTWKKNEDLLPFGNDMMRHPMESRSIIYVDSTYGTKVYNLDQRKFHFDSVYNFEYLAGYGHGKIAMTASGKFVSIGRQKRILMRESLTDRWKLHCLTPSFLFSFIMYNDSLGWIGSLNGNIFRTSDGGVTWLPQDTFLLLPNNNLRVDNRLQFFAYKDSLNIVGYHYKGGMVSSDNGGKVVKENRSQLNGPNISQVIALPGKGYYMAWNINYQNSDSIFYYSYLSYSESGSGWDTLIARADSSNKINGFPSYIFYTFIHNKRLWYSVSSAKADSLYYSDDNGMTFQKALFESMLGKLNTPVFIDDTLGFIRENNPSFTQFGLLRTTDAGMTWQKMSNTIRFRQIWADPQNKNILYAIANVSQTSKESELYRSVDKGITWTQENIRGLDFTRYGINTIIATPTQTYVRGGGSFDFLARVLPPSTAVGIEQEEERLPRALVPLRWVSVHPNPFTQKTTFTMICHSLMFPNGVTIKAYNGEGTEIDDLTDDFRQGKRVDNKVVFEWSPPNLMSGVYYIQALSNGYTETIKTIYVPEKK